MSPTVIKRVAHLSVVRVRTTALILCLIVSAYVMALSLGSAGYPGLRWLALLPLFAAMRGSRPAAAMFAGALWGACLCVFSAAAVDSGISMGLVLAAGLIGIPAVYMFLGSWVTHRIGFNPLVLGVAWMGVESALGPIGLGTGLLGEGDGGGTILHWVGQAFGYVLVAFSIVLVNASVVSVLGRTSLGVALPRYLRRSNDRGAPLLPQICYCFPRFVIRPSQPRAPPIPLAHS